MLVIKDSRKELSLYIINKFKEREEKAMGQKDLREKLLEDHEDVFSDIFNGLLFGRNVIKQQYLKSGSTESVYKAENGECRDQL